MVTLYVQPGKRRYICIIGNECLPMFSHSQSQPPLLAQRRLFHRVRIVWCLVFTVYERFLFLATVSNAYSLPYQCTTYTLNQDSTRYYTYYCSSCYCDGLSGWYRFSGVAGTRLISSPVSTGYCGANYPGWFNGTHPTTVGATSIGTGCVNVNGVLCQAPYSVLSVYVTNCNGFYVYYLTPFSYCYSRYCTI